mmetsp:Transcript_91466/g.191183  ORF Transcript_91466/g.191183 Transcript_91466/m.191183 type:complete len:92 (-) Transcript_91466:32-307(-)
MRRRARHRRRPVLRVGRVACWLLVVGCCLLVAPHRGLDGSLWLHVLFYSLLAVRLFLAEVECLLVGFSLPLEGQALSRWALAHKKEWIVIL